MEWLEQLEWKRELWVLLDVFIAMVLGGLVGLERERQQKPAGLRTHMLIAGAASVLVFLGISMSETSIAMMEDSVIGVDPIRIIQAIIVGVSFIGAGTIFKSGGEGEKAVENDKVKEIKAICNLISVEYKHDESDNFDEGKNFFGTGLQ